MSKPTHGWPVVAIGVVITSLVCFASLLLSALVAVTMPLLGFNFIASCTLAFLAFLLAMFVFLNVMLNWGDK